MNVTITAVNDAPTASNLTQSLTLGEDAAAPKLFTAAPVVPDIDSANVTATLTLSSTGAGALVGAGTPAGTVYTISGTLAAVNTALANVTFAPAQDFNGTASVAVAIDDGQTARRGRIRPARSRSPSRAVNDPPIANPDTLASIAEDSGARPIRSRRSPPTTPRGRRRRPTRPRPDLTVTGVSNPSAARCRLIRQPQCDLHADRRLQRHRLLRLHASTRHHRQPRRRRPAIASFASRR